MSIPLIKEIDNFGPYEKCYFCSSTCITWHENTNNPVCTKCAKIHEVKELPDFGQIVRKNKRNK